MDDEEFLKEFDDLIDGAESESDAPTDTQAQEETDLPSGEDETPVEEEGEVLAVEESDTSGSGEDEEEVVEELEEEFDTSSVDLSAFYNSVMKPFKANGKTIEIKNPEDAQQLMKMGANYTRKMQEISAHRKTIATLEEHGITSEAEIAFLIDLKNKNPEAIQKLFKESGIDPFDIDTTKDVNYKPSVNMVSEKTLDARSVLDDLRSTPAGSETLNLIADTWDNESTSFMWDNPQSFQIIHEQRESGVFDKIMHEVDRQTSLGYLSPNQSIMEKYNIVGNQLFLDGQPNDNNTRKPIDTRTATRSSANRSSDRAKAASSPRASKRTSMVLEDYSKLSDSDFLKAMADKL